VAVDTPWSTGQVEGQADRLKTIKRQMYGRAGFELLYARAAMFARGMHWPMSCTNSAEEPTFP